MKYFMYFCITKLKKVIFEKKKTKKSSIKIWILKYLFVLLQCEIKNIIIWNQLKIFLKLMAKLVLV